MCFSIDYFISPHSNAEIDITSHSADEGRPAQQGQAACKDPQLLDVGSEFELRSVSFHFNPKVMLVVTKSKTHKISQREHLIQCPHFTEEETKGEVIPKYAKLYLYIFY